MKRVIPFLVGSLFAISVIAAPDIVPLPVLASITNLQTLAVTSSIPVSGYVESITITPSLAAPCYTQTITVASGNETILTVTTTNASPTYYVLRAAQSTTGTDLGNTTNAVYVRPFLVNEKVTVSATIATTGVTARSFTYLIKLNDK